MASGQSLLERSVTRGGEGGSASIPSQERGELVAFSSSFATGGGGISPRFFSFLRRNQFFIKGVYLLP